jgi:hypothetical protein
MPSLGFKQYHKGQFIWGQQANYGLRKIKWATLTFFNGQLLLFLIFFFFLEKNVAGDGLPNDMAAAADNNCWWQ